MRNATLRGIRAARAAPPLPTDRRIRALPEGVGAHKRLRQQPAQVALGDEAHLHSALRVRGRACDDDRRGAHVGRGGERITRTPVWSGLGLELDGFQRQARQAVPHVGGRLEDGEPAPAVRLETEDVHDERIAQQLELARAQTGEHDEEEGAHLRGGERLDHLRTLESGQHLLAPVQRSGHPGGATLAQILLRPRRGARVHVPQLHIVLDRNQTEPVPMLGALDLAALVAAARGARAEDRHEVVVLTHALLEQLHLVLVERQLAQLHIDLRLGDRRHVLTEPRLEHLRPSARVAAPGAAAASLAAAPAAAPAATLGGAPYGACRARARRAAARAAQGIGRPVRHLASTDAPARHEATDAPRRLHLPPVARHGLDRATGAARE